MEKTIQLKNYQRKALHEVNTNYANGIKSQLLVMATGTGKTVVFCEFIKELISVEKKVLILVHRDELINQAERRLKLHTSEPFGIEKAERKANNENIVLASVQTLKGKRLKKFAKDYFDVIVIDECHRSTANSYMTVRNHFKKSHVLGVTATPERQDDLKITKKHFQKIAFTYNLLDAIKEGSLANIRVWRVESEQDISDVKSNSDDLDQKALAKVLDNDEYLEFIYKTITEKAFNKKIMVFMPSVKMSDKLADLLNSKGLSAFSVNSNTPLEKRQEVLEDYRKGKIKVLSNYNIFTEGFDEPSIDCVVMARPTKSEIFYSQALGRMTRLFEGKGYGMLIDIGFINNKHKLIGIFNLLLSGKPSLPKIREVIKNLNGMDIVILYNKVIEYINSLPNEKIISNKEKTQNMNLVLSEMSIHDIISYSNKKSIPLKKHADLVYSKYIAEHENDVIPEFIEVDYAYFSKDDNDFRYESRTKKTFLNTIQFIKLIKKLGSDNIYLDFEDMGNFRIGIDLFRIYDNRVSLGSNIFKFHEIYIPVNKKTFQLYIERSEIVEKYGHDINRSSTAIRSFIDSAKHGSENSKNISYAKRRKKDLEGLLLLENLYKKINPIRIKKINTLLEYAQKYKINLMKSVSKHVKIKQKEIEARQREEDERFKKMMSNMFKSDL